MNQSGQTLNFQGCYGRMIRSPEWLAAAVLCGLLMGGVIHGAYVAYDLHPIWFAEQAFLHQRPVYELRPDELPYNYPPSSLLLLAPLGLVSWPFAHVLWWASQVIFLVGIWATAIRIVDRPLSSRFAALALVGACVSTPVVSGLHLYNITVLATLLVGLALLAAQREHWLWAGIAIGLGLSVKPLAIVLLLLPLLYRRYASVCMAASVTVVLNLAALPFVTDVTKLGRVLDGFLKGGGPNRYNVSLVQLGLAAHVPSPAILAVRLLLAIALLAASIPLAHRSAMDAAGVLLLMQLLCFGTTWSHYLMLLIFPVTSWWSRQAIPVWGFCGAVAIAASAWLLPDGYAGVAVQTGGLIVLAAAVLASGPVKALSARWRGGKRIFASRPSRAAKAPLGSQALPAD